MVSDAGIICLAGCDRDQERETVLTFPVKS